MKSPLMRKLLVAVVAAAALLVGSGSALAHPPAHWHCLQTPNGKWHLIAPGVTDNATHRALEEFHFNVHRGVFGVTGAGPFDVEGKHPLGPVLLVFQPACPS